MTKRKIFATLGNEVKAKLNKEDYPQEYQGALSVKSKGKNVACRTREESSRLCRIR